MSIRQLSPNFSSRQGYKPEAIVIHIGEGNNPGLINWIISPKSKVSYHYVIDVNGLIFKCVDDREAAWHAGVVRNSTWSLLKPNVNPNLYTIGIAFEGFADKDITEKQYAAGARLIQELCKQHNIPVNRSTIIPHRLINSHKSCPGKVDINRLISAKWIQCPFCNQEFILPTI